MSGDKLGCALAISAAKHHMSQAEQLIVSQAMSSRMHQLHKELEKHVGENIDAARWAQIVIAASYKVLGLEQLQKEIAMLNEPLYIVCNACKSKSFNTHDIDRKFCGSCHKFHEAATDYEVGPTPESLSLGFSWIDEGGKTWHCPRSVEEHGPYECDACVQVIDNVMGPRTTTPEDMIKMVTACRAHLTLEERAELHRAISHHETEMITALMAHGGRTISDQEWAQLILSCARDVLKQADEGTTP